MADSEIPSNFSSGTEQSASIPLPSQLSPLGKKFYDFITDLQHRITLAVEAEDGRATFREDRWERQEGGGGLSRVMEKGSVFEKAGVNISAVHGQLPESMRQYFNVGEVDFFACGLSLVIHPENPHVPTVHANWRYFEMYGPDGTLEDRWFGGGLDLTPYYLYEEDVRHFHGKCREVCDRYDPLFYPAFKKACDEYFYNSHRGEARGVGGLFFDYCKEEKERSMEDWFQFVTAVANTFTEAYLPIVSRRKEMDFSDSQRTWQEIRRGRYVEFNLVHDKGTLFGLKTNGRIESILMSLPPQVRWKYDHHPEKDSPEEELQKVLMEPRDWV